ncbi:MAG: RlmE family RNA methyltransferase [Proteobacteria bacterium]|nr:RlmE family RNA methyltransferase [Pseudomonadota bacterium]
MKKSKSSGRWLAEHENDEFVQRARQEGYRSRASYKLLEISDRFDLIRRGMTVVDLGAAPGGWCQVAKTRTGPAGTVIGLDILPMEPIDGVTLIEGDFTEDGPYQALIEALDGKSVDLVISDMAPNLSGTKAIDQPRAMYLVELAVDFAASVLKPGGSLLVKCFEGEGINAARQDFSERFAQVSNVKPRASRGRSREIYLLGRGYRS